MPLAVALSRWLTRSEAIAARRASPKTELELPMNTEVPELHCPVRAGSWCRYSHLLSLDSTVTFSTEYLYLSRTRPGGSCSHAGQLRRDYASATRIRRSRTAAECVWYETEHAQRFGVCQSEMQQVRRLRTAGKEALGQVRAGLARFANTMLVPIRRAAEDSLCRARSTLLGRQRGWVRAG